MAPPGVLRAGAGRLARPLWRAPALGPQPCLLGKRARVPRGGGAAGGGSAVAPLTLAHPESLSPRAQELLARLGSRPWAEDFYIAGSAALALYVGHRPVTDLDLMGNANRLTSPERRDLLQEL